MWDALLACLSSSRRPCRRMVVVGHSFSYFAWDVGVRGLWPRPGPKPRRKPAGGPARSASRRLLLSAPRPDGPHRAARAASVPQAAASCGLSESPSWLAVVRVVAVPAPARPPPRGRGIQGRLQRPRHLLSLSAAAASPPRSRRGSFSLRAPHGSMPPRGGPRGASSFSASLPCGCFDQRVRRQAGCSLQPREAQTHAPPHRRTGLSPRPCSWDAAPPRKKATRSTNRSKKATDRSKALHGHEQTPPSVAATRAMGRSSEARAASQEGTPQCRRPLLPGEDQHTPRRERHCSFLDPPRPGPRKEQPRTSAAMNDRTPRSTRPGRGVEDQRPDATINAPGRRVCQAVVAGDPHRPQDRLLERVAIIHTA